MTNGLDIEQRVCEVLKGEHKGKFVAQFKIPVIDDKPFSLGPFETRCEAGERLDEAIRKAMLKLSEYMGDT